MSRKEDVEKINIWIGQVAADQFVENARLVGFKITDEEFPYIAEQFFCECKFPKSSA